MPLFPRPRRTRITSTTQLKEQFLRELSNEANGVLRQLSQQFTQDLQSQAANLLRGSTGNGGATDSNDPFGGAAQLIASGARYMLSKPTTTQTITESARSQETDTRFRLSQSQALAEANMAIAKGDKNL